MRRRDIRFIFCCCLNVFPSIVDTQFGPRVGPTSDQLLRVLWQLVGVGEPDDLLVCPPAHGEYGEDSLVGTRPVDASAFGGTRLDVVPVRLRERRETTEWPRRAGSNNRRICSRRRCPSRVSFAQNLELVG